MTDKKDEWEIDSSKDYFSVETEILTADLRKSDALVGQMLDGRFLIEQDLTEGGADAGGIGLVYLAKDMKLMGKKTVVKILRQAAFDANGTLKDVMPQSSVSTNLCALGVLRVKQLFSRRERRERRGKKVSQLFTDPLLKDEKNARQLADFLQKYKHEKNETTKDTANQQTVVKGKGETIVQKIELEHR